MNTSNGNGIKLKESCNKAESHQLPSFTATPLRNAVELTPNPKIHTSDSKRLLNKFEQTVILQQSSLWSRVILWSLMGVTTTVIVWACIAKIEEAIPATGKLEPVGTVKEVQAPISGVVKTVYVKDGQRVKKGDRLLKLDPSASKAQLASLQKIRISLFQENQFYAAVMRGISDTTGLELARVWLWIDVE